MFEKRATDAELMDDHTLASDQLHDNLIELEYFNRKFGSIKLLIQALNLIKRRFSQDKIIIADFGCGGGDMLLAMNQWAVSKKIAVELYGFDVNPFMINFAKKQAHAFPHISFDTMDILAIPLTKKFDVICLNSICHHFSDEEMIALLKRVSQQANVAVIINDLHRHWLSYLFIKIFSYLRRFTDLVKHDAPLSILRAFRKEELHHLLEKAEIQNYQIRWVWPFRWKIIIWS